jgi:hypothetical protein
MHTASEMTAPSGSGTAAAQQQPPRTHLSAAQRCHTDALHCIFACLALKELLPALHSCRGWHAAGCREASRCLGVRLSPSSLPALSVSSLRHHVSSVSFHLTPLPTLGQICLLRALPRLTAVDACMHAGDLCAQMASAGDSRRRRAQLVSEALPPQLQRLTLRLSCPSSVPLPFRQALVDALPSLPQLVALRLSLAAPDLDLTPLTQLPMLSRLRLEHRLTAEQCSVVKQLPALVALDSGGERWDPAALLELLAPPHSLERLEELDLHAAAVDPPLLAGLLSLPSLSSLQPSSIAPECWAELGGLARLRSLCLTWAGPFSAAQRAALGASLARLSSRLWHLTLKLMADGGVEGPPLHLLRLHSAPTLPLRSLQLYYLRVPSLAFLQHTPLLERLVLADCREVSADDVMRCLRAHPPPRLSELVLARSCLLSGGQQEDLHPPSSLLPALKHFSYSP